MSRALVLDYLESHPDGATPQEIADHTGLNAYSVRLTLGRMESRREASKIGGPLRGLHTVWVGYREPTPPVFRAMETLRAMQDACRARLMANQLEAV